MEFTIYTTGSAEFLEIMLNASAMITSSGTSENLARIGMMLGLLILAFTAVFNNQGISFQKAGLVFVLYLMFYGPTATTVIEDTTSGQVRVVDNVPVGPAFVGSVISTVAYEITRVSEQAFSTPAMTDYGLFSSLTTLSKVRDALRNPLGLDGFQNYRAAEGWRLHDTYKEFITYCILNPIALRESKNVADLYREASMANMLASPMANQSIYVYNGPAGGTLMSCSEAQPLISTSLNAVYREVLSDILNKGFANEKAGGRMLNGDHVEIAADDAIQSFGISGKRAQEFVLTSLISPVFNNSRVDALNHWQEQRAAMALRESMNHQEIQWAGKGDTFKHYMRPMIAFFEGLLYAMTPFMAFALLLGGPGLSVLGKYLVLPLAIGLWMPLLSIVNAFTLWYAGNQMQVVFDGNGGLSEGFSMLQVMDMDHAIGKALGIGGLLAASVPPLALFIVSGSAMVMNSIMSQMTQGDKFKSEDVLPRSQQSAPVLNTTSMFTSDQVSKGVSTTGSVPLSESFTGDQVATAALQSSKSAANSTMSQYQSNLTAAGSQLTSTSTGREAMAQIGETMRASSALRTNAAYNEGVENLRSLGFTDSAINQVTAGAGMGGQGGALAASAHIKTAEGKTLSEMSSSQRGSAEKAIAQVGSSIENAQSNEIAFATGDAFKRSSLAQSSVSNSDAVSKSQATALQAQQNYSETASKQDSIRAGQSLSLRDAGVNALKRSGQTSHETGLGMQALAGRTESGRALYEQAYQSQSIKDLSKDDDERRSMAALRAMNQDGRLGELIGSRYNPFEFGINQGNASANEGLVGKVAEANSGASGLSGQFDSRWAGNDSGYSGTTDMNVSGMQAAKDQGADLINMRNADNQETTLGRHESNRAQVQNLNDGDASDRLRTLGKNADDRGILMNAATATQAIQSGLKSLGSLISSGENTQFRDDFIEGQQSGLTDSQAALRAASRTGVPADSDIFKWASYHTYSEAMIASGGDQDYAKGVHASLTQQAAGSAGYSADNPVIGTVAGGNRNAPLPSSFKKAELPSDKATLDIRPRRPSGISSE